LAAFKLLSERSEMANQGIEHEGENDVGERDEKGYGVLDEK
jgi:hypothetical protein